MKLVGEKEYEMFIKIYLIIGFLCALSLGIDFKNLSFIDLFCSIVWLLFWPFLLLFFFGTLYFLYHSTITLASASRMKTGNDLKEQYEKTKKEMSFIKFLIEIWKEYKKEK
jgi:hypothetical protein